MKKKSKNMKSFKIRNSPRFHSIVHRYSKNPRIQALIKRLSKMKSKKNSKRKVKLTKAERLQGGGKENITDIFDSFKTSKNKKKQVVDHVNDHFDEVIDNLGKDFNKLSTKVKSLGKYFGKVKTD